mmetsp:Transcript_53260/g.114420  ORF Transcript_53260/g.114420 Transcript_53260/m.114420 type:complete len:241 (-) Transcript_53260:1259-1981(-)
MIPAGRGLVAELRQEAPQVLNALPVDEEVDNLFVDLWLPIVWSVPEDGGDGGGEISAALPVEAQRWRGRVGFDRRQDVPHDLLWPASQELIEALGLHQGLHQQWPHEVLKDPEPQGGIAAAANKKEGPLRVQSEAVDVRVMLIGNMQAPAIDHVPNTDGGVPGAAKQDPWKLAMPEQPADVGHVADELPKLSSAARDTGVPIPHADGLVVAARRDEVGASGVESQIEDPRPMPLQRDSSL